MAVRRQSDESDDQTGSLWGLSFRLKELRTFSCFPVSQHSGFYFPPAASKDRAVNSMEIKDFIILWTYSQWRQAIVVIPPLSPERKTCCMLSIWWSFCILSFLYIGNPNRPCCGLFYPSFSLIGLPTDFRLKSVGLICLSHTMTAVLCTWRFWNHIVWRHPKRKTGRKCVILDK